MTDKQLKIDKIMKVIGTTSFGEDGDGFPLELLMIGDVLDRFYSNIELPVNERKSSCDSILFERKKKRNPIEEQSEECIDFIYNLILGN